MYIGIDVGGTNLKAGLVDDTGTLVKVERVPLDFQGPEPFARTLAELAGKVMAEKVRWVGVGHIPSDHNSSDFLPPPGP